MRRRWMRRALADKEKLFLNPTFKKTKSFKIFWWINLEPNGAITKRDGRSIEKPNSLNSGF